jgi:hypothetical protein
VLLRDGAARRPGDGGDLRREVAALDLVDHHQPLLAVDLDRERRAGARPQRRMAALRRQLDRVRRVVAAPDDDQVLEAAGDEQLAAAQEAEIAGAQEGTLPGAVEEGLERARALLRLVPVALGDARPRQPDLAEAIGRRGGARLGIGDDHPMAGHHGAAAHQRPAPRRASRRFDHLARRERPGLEAAGDRWLAQQAAGDQQGGLGEPVAGIEGGGAKAAGGEVLREASEGVGADRLGTREGMRPAGEVEALALLGTEGAQAQVVGEVRAAADRGPLARDGGEPAGGPLQERHRRQDRHPDVAVQRLQHAADEPHVVVGRQPGHGAEPGVVVEVAADLARVGEQVAMADHHALGLGGGARGVLEEGEVATFQLRPLPEVRLRLPFRPRRQPAQRGQLRRMREAPREVGEDGGGGQRRRRPGIGDDRLQAGRWPVGPGGVGGDRHGAGVQAAEEGRDVVEARRVEQQHPLAGESLPRQLDGDGPRPAVQLAIGQGHRVVRVPLGQEVEDHPLGLVLRPPAQQVDQAGAGRGGQVAVGGGQAVSSCRGRGRGRVSRSPAGLPSSLKPRLAPL